MRSTLLPGLLLCAVPAAQNPTSPAGFEFNEGSGMELQWFGNRRHQQFDNTHRGTPMLIRGIAFRRDSDIAGGNTATSRSTDIRVRMDEIDMAQIEYMFEPNFRQPTEVVARRTVNVPDWTTFTQRPSPFDFIVPFDTPWQYTGAAALLIDFDYENSTSQDVMFCDTEVSATAWGEASIEDGGCPQSSDGRIPYLLAEVQNSGSMLPNFGMRIGMRVYNSIPLSPTFLLIGFTDPNVTIPGLCGPLRVDPLAAVFIGDTDAFGFREYLWLSFPWAGDIAGLSVRTQALQFEQNSQYGLPLVFSNAVRNVMPDSPWVGVECAYHTGPTTLSPATDDAELVFGSGLVIELRL